MLSASEETALRDGTLSLDFLNLRLVHNGGRDRRLEGPGTIRQDVDGDLELRMYAPSATFDIEGLRVQAGELIPESEYYTLTGTDVSGRTWKAKYILPRERFANGGGSIVTTQLGEISCDDDRPTKGSQIDSVALEFAAPFNLPANKTTVVEKDEAGVGSKSSRRNVLAFPMGQWEVRVVEGEQASVATITAPVGLIDTSIERAVCDALQFSTGRLALPFRAVYRHGDIVTTRLRSTKRRVERESQLAPLDRRMVTASQDYSRLFRCYFDFVKVPDGAEPHQLAVQWDAIVRGGGAGLDTQALILSVAVEAIAQLTPKGTAQPLSDEDEAFRRALIENVTRGVCTEELRERLLGLLNAMTGRRAVDSLHQLAAAGAIDRSLVKSWKWLRNRAAHGQSAAERGVEDLLRHVSDVLTLLHQMVFFLVGYTGPYVNYSAPGWPVVTYPAGPAEAEPSRVGA